MAYSFENLVIDVSDGIATLVVQRPEKLNALNEQTLAELDRALRGLSEDAEVRGIIVTGAGSKAFVAGADIGELVDLSALESVRASRRGQATFRALESSAKPVVAAVNGFALGGGLELALACHIRLASEKARFGLPEVKLGIIPGYGGTVRLPRLVGKGRALEMILTGEMIDATEAHRIGLVNRVTPADELIAAAGDLVRRILANGPVAVALALEAVDTCSEISAADGFAYEAQLFGLLGGTADKQEGMKAFLEKRIPAFQGR